MGLSLTALHCAREGAQVLTQEGVPVGAAGSRIQAELCEGSCWPSFPCGVPPMGEGNTLPAPFGSLHSELRGEDCSTSRSTGTAPECPMTSRRRLISQRALGCSVGLQPLLAPPGPSCRRPIWGAKCSDGGRWGPRSP